MRRKEEKGGEEEEENKLKREKKSCETVIRAHPTQPIAGQSLLTRCGSTNVARSKYAKEGREGGEETFKIQQKKKLNYTLIARYHRMPQLGCNFTAEGEESTYAYASDGWTIVIIVVIDRSC